MNAQKLNFFVNDIENLHNEVSDVDIKAHLHAKFADIKEKYLIRKEKNKNDHEEVEKKLKTSLREMPELVEINIGEIKSQCDNNTRAERLSLINRKIKFMEGEGLLISSLKGFLLMKHRDAIGIKPFYKFLADTRENYHYSLFLIKLYKLLNNYKQLQRCKLPVRYFKEKYPMIKQICQNNPEEWE